MSNYIIFGGEVFYATGGGYDFIGVSGSVEEALDLAMKSIGGKRVFSKPSWSDNTDDQPRQYVEWSHVLDLSTRKIIAKFGREPLGEAELVPVII